MSATFAPGGGAYDSTTNPAVLGSSGGTGSTNGGAGGGVAQFFIGGSLQLNGHILADGLPGTNAHSGGGGGCIAIYFATNNFTGAISAFGGAGTNYGGAGTIYTQPIGGPAGQLLIANHGVRGTNTSFAATALSNLSILGGAVAQGRNSTFAVSNLFVGSNSLLISQDSLALTITINGDVAIESNAAVNADFKSFGGSGSGHGNAPNQNFLVASPSDFNFGASHFDGTNLGFSWYGINGVTYQPLYSSNLVNWSPFGSPFIGSNAPATFAVPATNAPQLFFRLGVSY